MYAIRMLPSLTNLGAKVSGRSWSVNYSTIKRLSLEEKLGFPERPKKPISPYLQFCKQNFVEVSNMHPKSTFIEVTQKIAEKWKLVDLETKTKMMNEYHEKVKKHPEALQQYYNSLTDAQRVQLEAAKKIRNESLQKIRYRLELKKTGKPNRPANAFGMFVKDVYSKMAKDSAKSYGKAYIKEIAEMWNSLTPEEKEPFKLKCEEDGKKYQKALAEWEEEMVRQGKTNLIRMQSQPALDESKKFTSIKSQTKDK